jgi:class 3 adenylate cyclase
VRSYELGRSHLTGSQSGPTRVGVEDYPHVVASSSRTRYARCGDVDIAYQVLGDGALDLLLYSGWAVPIDCMDEDPSMARFQRRLSSFSRLIRFDVRGVGSSDRGSASIPPTLRQWADDGVSVLDAVGSERAVVFAPYRHSPVGVVLAVANPERVISLIVVNGMARMLQADDYPMGIPQSVADRALEMGVESDAFEQGLDVLGVFAPSVADDPSFRAWWDRSGNMGTTPAMARAIMQQNFQVDVRQLLPEVSVPTLIVHGAEVRIPGVDNGRYLAEHIPGAKFAELPGVDTFYWTGDMANMLGEIEEFMTGVRSGQGAERILATVLFTDVVDSTDRAATVGDRRWRDLLDRHDQSVRGQIQRFQGREVNTVGDGFFATFDSPGRAIECAMAIREALQVLDIEVRAGIHTGEIEVRGDDLAGLTVHIGARVSALAGPGEVLVSSTVKDLVVGSTFEFSERGEHELKGVPGMWRLYVVHQ